MDMLFTLEPTNELLATHALPFGLPKTGVVLQLPQHVAWQW